MLDGFSVINYTPNSCWTAPRSQPPDSQPYVKGKCSVCVLQRNGTNGEADYQFWARDDDNNAMGNIGPTTVWPLDGLRIPGGNQYAITNMGQSPLKLFAMLGTPPQYSMAFLSWNGTADGTEVQFDPSPPVGPQGACVPAGTATSGQVVYFTCVFDC